MTTAMRVETKSSSALSLTSTTIPFSQVTGVQTGKDVRESQVTIMITI